MSLKIVKKCACKVSRFFHAWIFVNGQEPATHESGGGVLFIENMKN
jgi:hypothetical protein